ncbi:DinB family protein [Dinghuibacter silviterrae]|uniref:DinB family protein n=1 Tax=Dinghuibacter silviterrae TaxID=1539049 RepID=A0A4R8DHP4_9BACT|nr:DinB family protein [Dinghuibacter silviterrae]TDW96470.1 DinB family protein [Dinghuibacter silviterrae]
MIPFDLNDTLALLERTPDVLDNLLEGLAPAWLMNNEGGDSWSPHDVLCHLIECEAVNWIPRIDIILSDKEDKRFVPFDRFRNLDVMKEQPVAALLEEFKKRRTGNIAWLRSRKIGPGYNT